MGLVIPRIIWGITSQRTGEMMFEEVSSLKISLARRGDDVKIEPKTVDHAAKLFSVLIILYRFKKF